MKSRLESNKKEPDKYNMVSQKEEARMGLPKFKYHPDPVDTGSIEKSDTECASCGRNRGFIYVGPVYSVEEYDDCICPWCIADGSAHDKLDVVFQDQAGIPGSSFPDSPDVADSIIKEVSERTPGFSGWQQEQWFTCCDDAAAFLGRAGYKELNEKWRDAIPIVKNATSLDGAEWEHFFNMLDKDGGPAAYIFRCLHCGKIGAYQDSH